MSGNLNSEETQKIEEYEKMLVDMAKYEKKELKRLIREDRDKNYSKPVKEIKCQECLNDMFKITFVYIHKNSREIKTCSKCGAFLISKSSPSTLHKAKLEEVKELLEKQRILNHLTGEFERKPTKSEIYNRRTYEST